MKQRSRLFSSYYVYGWRRIEGDALCACVVHIVVSSPLDDLCIDIWISAMIMSQHPDTRETGDSNVLVSHYLVAKS